MCLSPASPSWSSAPLVPHLLGFIVPFASRTPFSSCFLLHRIGPLSAPVASPRRRCSTGSCLQLRRLQPSPPRLRQRRTVLYFVGALCSPSATRWHASGLLCPHRLPRISSWALSVSLVRSLSFLVFSGCVATSPPRHWLLSSAPPPPIVSSQPAPAPCRPRFRWRVVLPSAARRRAGSLVRLHQFPRVCSDERGKESIAVDKVNSVKES